MRTIILSCAHGINVPGKQSPDGQHKEYRWSRDILYIVANRLTRKGIRVILIPEQGNNDEPGLRKRVEMENKINGPSFVFSLHNNAAGYGKEWKQARGIEIWTSPGPTLSDSFATQIYERLQKEFPILNGDFPLKTFWRKNTSDNDPDKEEMFTELLSKHPAVLLEWLFQDNISDLNLLRDVNINSKLINVLVDELYKIART